MYNRETYPRTPKWARHIRRLSKVSNFEFPSELNDLTKITSWGDDFKPVEKFGRRECAALQYMMDWNGRCVMLDSKNPTLCRSVVLAGIELIGSKRILVFVKTAQEVAIWSNIIRSNYPEDAQVHVNASRVRQTASGNPEEASRTWVIAAHRESVDVSLVGDYQIDHMIIESDDGNVHYEATDVLSGMATEIFRTTFIARMNDFWSDPTDNRRHVDLIGMENIVSQVVRTNTNMIAVPSVVGSSMSVSAYYRSRGVKLNTMQLYEACGVCTSLVIDESSVWFKNIQNTSYLGEVGSQSKRRSEIIQRYEHNEAAAVAELGKPLREIVDLAMQGSQTHRDRLEALKTQDWSKLKASTFFNMLQNTHQRDEKTIIVTNNRYIRNYMTMSVGAIELQDTVNGQIQQYANFCYPNVKVSDFPELGHHQSYRINNRLVVDSIAHLPTKLFEVADRIIFCEFPYDAEEIADLVELAKVFRFKMFFGTLRGTFEEHLAEKLLEPYY